MVERRNKIRHAIHDLGIARNMSAQQKSIRLLIHDLGVARFRRIKMEGINPAEELGDSENLNIFSADELRVWNELTAFGCEALNDYFECLRKESGGSLSDHAEQTFTTMLNDAKKAASNKK